MLNFHFMKFIIVYTSPLVEGKRENSVLALLGF